MAKRINDVTVGDTYLCSVLCDGTKHNVTFYLGTRAEANKPMIIETVRHFISAVGSIANGDVEAAEGFDKRGDFGKSPHGEARIAIWVKAPGIPVLMPKGMRFIQVNVFTEETHVNDFINDVYEHVYTMSDILETGAVRLARQPKPKSALDKHFPRDKNGKPTNPPAPRGDVAAPKNVAGERPVFDYLGKEARLAIEQDYAGQVVGLQLGAIERKTHKFDSGDIAEQIVFWPPGGDYEYNYRTVVTVDDRDNNYGLKTLKKSGILERLPDPGYKIPLIGIAYFKLNKGKGDYVDNVYWNFHSLVAGDVSELEAEAPPIERQQQEFVPPPANPDDIPF